MGDKKKADAHFQECLSIRNGLAGDPKAKLERIDLMVIKARCGQYAEAAEMAEEIIKTPPRDARVYFQSACGFALCAGAANEVAESVEAKSLARHYETRAFEALEQGLKAGWRNAVDVETDPDLDPIRRDPRFAAMVKEFRSATGN